MNQQDIIIRPLHPDDGADIYAIASDPRVNRTLLLLPSMEFAETEAWIAGSDPRNHRMVAELDGLVVGSVTLRQPPNPRLAHSGHIGLMVHHDYWGRGVGSALMAAVIDLADNWFHMLRLELEVLANNPAAVHLYEKFGFELEGTKRMVVFGDGRYQDEHVMARIHPQAPQRQPMEPLHFAGRGDVAAITTRPLRRSDVAEINAINRHPAVGRGTLQLPSQEIQVVIDRQEKWGSDLHRYAAVATHEDGSEKVVGITVLHLSKRPRMRHKGSLGMSVHPDYWGLGVGTRLMETIIELADNWLGLTRLELEVHTDNQEAIHLYQKFDFKIEGTKRLHSFGGGGWTDAHFMARLQEFPKSETNQQRAEA